MKNFDKYEKTYFMPPECTYDWVKKDAIDTPPIWCSVDLRDGNLALIVKIQRDIDLRLFSSSVYRCFAHLISPPCQIWLQ